MDMKLKIATIILLFFSFSVKAEEPITYDDIQALSKKVSSGDNAAFLETLELTEKNIMAAATTEHLMVVAGIYSVVSPEKYLSGIYKWHQKSDTAKRFGCLGISSLGESYVDELDLQKAELTKRIQLISAINNKNISSIKTMCINTLEKSLLLFTKQSANKVMVSD